MPTTRTESTHEMRIKIRSLRPSKRQAWYTIAKEALDTVSKIVSMCAIAFAGYWAYHQFKLGGEVDWVDNMTLSTEIQPYTSELRILIVHIKSKNPRPTVEIFEKKDSTFTLTIRQIPADLKAGQYFDDTIGKLIASANLLPDDGYELVPLAELDDMRAFIVPADSLLSVTAELTAPDDPRGKDTSTVSASTVVKIPK